MIFKPTTWYRIAVALTALNLAGLGYAVGVAEPMHAGVHGVLTLAFGVWAQRLRRGAGRSEDEASLEALGAEDASRLEALEGAVNSLRQALSETQERLDFAERLLAQASEKRRVDPPR